VWDLEIFCGRRSREQPAWICSRKWAARLRTYQQLFLSVGAGIPLRDGSRCAPRLKLVLSMHVSVAMDDC
jgi:hypothetical protein